MPTLLRLSTWADRFQAYGSRRVAFAAPVAFAAALGFADVEVEAVETTSPAPVVVPTNPVAADASAPEPQNANSPSTPVTPTPGAAPVTPTPEGSAPDSAASPSVVQPTGPPTTPGGAETTGDGQPAEGSPTPDPSAVPTVPGAAPQQTPPPAPPVPQVIRWEGGSGGFEFVPPTDAEQPEKVRFAFQETPWPVVLEQFARWEKLSLDLTDSPPGSFTYFDETPRTPSEAIDVLNGYLLPRGYVVVRRHNFLVCVRTDSPQIVDLVPTVAIDDLENRGEQELVRVVVRTPQVDPEVAALEIEQLLGQHGSAKPLRNLQAVVVQGFGRSLRDAVAVIDGVAPPAKPDKLQFKSFPLRYVAAADAEKHVRDLFGLGSGTVNVSSARSDVERELRYRTWQPDRRRDDDDNREQRPSNDRLLAQVAANTQVSAVASTNNLLVTSTEEGLALIENVITSLDVARGDGVEGAAQKILRVYTIGEASAEEVAKTIDVLVPGVVVNEDRRQDSLHVFATPEKHLEVAELIQTLDGGGDGGTTVAVIPLRKYDAVAMSDLLGNMFENEDRDERPVIQAEPGSRTLVVRGTTQQVDQVRAALAAYGEGDIGPASATVGSRFRTIDVHADDAENIVRMAERILMEAPGRDAGLRVVVPNQAHDEPQVETPVEESDPKRDEVSSIRRVDLRDPTAPAPSPSAFGFAGAAASPSQEPVSANDLASFQYVRTIGSEKPNSVSTAKATNDGQQIQLSESEDVAGSPEERAASDDAAPSDDPSAADDSSNGGDEEAAPGERPRVHAIVRDGKIQLYSSDLRALDEAEEVVRELARTMPTRTNWTIFYLRAADATQTASKLHSLMPDAYLGSLFGPTSYDAVGSRPEEFDIVPEPRTNALFVSGTDAQIKRVEQLLELLDTVEVPPSLVARTPHVIPVRYADVNQLAALVSTLYKDRLTDPAAVQQAQEEDRRREEERNRGDGRDRDDDERRRREQERQSPPQPARGGRPQPTGPQLAIAVDPIARELIVACDELLYREIKTFVESRDVVARDMRETVEIVRLPQSFPAESQAALQVLQSISPNVTVTAVESPWSAAAPAPSSSRGPYPSRDYSRSSSGSSRDGRSSGR